MSARFSWKRAYLFHISRCSSCDVGELRAAFEAAGLIEPVIEGPTSAST